MLPDPVVEDWGGIQVVRDDLIQGGTKARVLHLLFDAHDEYVYASPVQGYAQIALAYCCAEHDKKATVVCAARGSRHPRTKAAIDAGASLLEVTPGYLNVVRRRAIDYCRQTGAVLLPFGMKDQRIIDGITNVARRIPYQPTEVWSVAGSGTLSLGLQQAWPDAEFNVVGIGAKFDVVGRARVWWAEERYEQPAKEPPPFPSCDNYDAKAWKFIGQYATPGALFWNVAG